MLTKTKIVLCCLALILGVSSLSSVHASGLFSKKEAKQTQDEVLELLDEAPPVEATPAPVAEPQTINEYANLYYKNCVQQDHPILKGEPLELQCGCVSAQIPQNMTVKQMREMEENTTEGNLQRSRMMLFVYMPCTEYSMKAITQNKCLNDPDIKSRMKYYRRVCECISDEMAQFMKNEAPKRIESAMRRGGTDIDPLVTIMGYPVFEEKSQHYKRKCVERHEYGNGR